MLFKPPELGVRELQVLGEIEELRAKLSSQLREPQRWLGSLRRITMARAVQGSNSIEGYNASLDDAAAIELGEEPLDVDTVTYWAYKGNNDALTFVLRQAEEANFAYSEQLLKSLHFMMTSYDMKTRPGQWRLGWIGVRNEATGELVYEGADVDEVPSLMTGLIDQLNDSSDTTPVIVRAGMAHLNLVMIHPFRDGNGRMGRCLQTLVLARERIVNPVFSSIEEYLGRNTPDYYKVLAEVGDGRWQPERESQPWVRFILTAHVRQERTMLRRFNESDRLWHDLKRIVESHNLPERVLFVLFDAALGFRVRNATYRAVVEDVSDQMASRDLKLLVDKGLLEAVGERRARHYIATKALRAFRQSIVDSRSKSDSSDPFVSG